MNYKTHDKKQEIIYNTYPSRERFNKGSKVNILSSMALSLRDLTTASVHIGVVAPSRPYNGPIVSRN
jgi:hypothetical protein